MPLTTAVVGATTAPITHTVDARWTMAYSASLGDMDGVYLDTSREGGVVAHPLFAICPEWPVALASRAQLRERGLSETEFNRIVHATHDTHIARLVRPGDVLTTTATVLECHDHRAGTFATTCFETVDQHAAPVCRTFAGMLIRGVDLAPVDGEAAATPAPTVDIPSTPHETSEIANDVVATTTLDVAAGLAHTYTECARIFNPIHTDRAAALAAGLPGLILHGSATLALAVSALLRDLAPGNPAAVARITCQFRGMVPMPAVLTLRRHAAPADVPGVVPFDVLDAGGAPVLARAALTLRD